MQHKALIGESGIPYRLRRVHGTNEDRRVFFEEFFHPAADEQGESARDLAGYKTYFMATEGAGYWVQRTLGDVDVPYALVAFWPRNSYERRETDHDPNSENAFYLNHHWYANLAACPPKDVGFLVRAGVEAMLGEHPLKEKIFAFAPADGPEAAALQEAGFKRSEPQAWPSRVYDSKEGYVPRKGVLWRVTRADVNAAPKGAF